MRCLVVVALAALASCYSPSFGDCQLTCGTSGMCPAGYDCKLGLCRVAGASGACGGVDGGGSGDAGLRAADYLAQAIAAQCEFYVRCGLFETDAVCLDNFTSPQVDNILRNIDAAITMGKVMFNADAAERCLASYDGRACTRDMEFGDRSRSTACLGVLVGTVSDGGICGLNEECISQNCSAAPQCPPGQCCSGMCIGSAPPSAKVVGDACVPDHDVCTNGYCDEQASGGPHCRDYQAMLAPCTSSDDCTLGTYCEQSNGNGMCFPLAGTGGSCSGGNASCLNIADICANNVCVAGGLTGDGCSASAGGGCQDFHHCNGMTCDSAPTANEQCGNFSFGQGCVGGTYCNMQSVCTPFIADGQPCPADPNASFYCASGYCDMATMKCTTQPVCI